MPRYKMAIQFDGKDYAGSQIQLLNGIEKAKTIQGELEKAICTLQGIDFSQTNNRPIKTIFSGRTDSGVSALSQIVHFDFDKKIVASKFIKSLNEILPDDIAVLKLEKVDEDFHAQKSAKSKHYKYVLINRLNKTAFDKGLLRIEKPLDVEKMQKALKYIEGVHDFTSFKNAGSENPFTECEIFEANCLKEGDFIIIDLIGNRFLYNMVRIIVGTLLMIEKNGLPSSEMKKILESKDRKRAGKTVQGYGLTLVKVEY